MKRAHEQLLEEGTYPNLATFLRSGGTLEVGDLEASQMGRRGSGAVFRVGVDCDRATTVDHLDELEIMIRLGLCCIFRDQPIKFRTTTATAIAA